MPQFLFEERAPRQVASSPDKSSQEASDEALENSKMPVRTDPCKHFSANEVLL